MNDPSGIRTISSFTSFPKSIAKRVFPPAPFACRRRASWASNGQPGQSGFGSSATAVTRLIAGFVELVLPPPADDDPWAAIRSPVPEVGTSSADLPEIYFTPFDDAGAIVTDRIDQLIARKLAAPDAMLLPILIVLLVGLAFTLPAIGFLISVFREKELV